MFFYEDSEIATNIRRTGSVSTGQAIRLDGSLQKFRGGWTIGQLKIFRQKISIPSVLLW